MGIGIHTGIGSGIWGMGHAVRMRALAAALTTQGAAVTFLTKNPGLMDFVDPFPCEVYRHVWPSLDIDVLVEDVPCQAPASWYQLLRQRYRVVRVDVPTATPETCDLLLAPVVHWAPETVAAMQNVFGTRFLYGWEYVLLETTPNLPRLPYAPRSAGPIVFASGGSSGVLLQQLTEWAGPNETEQEWIALLPPYGPRVSLPSWVHPEPYNRARVWQASLLITKFGITPYEAIIWGTPALMVTTSAADATDATRLALASHGAVRYLGRHGDLYPETVRTILELIQGAHEVRDQMHAASVGLLDGQGAVRAAHAILSL